MVQVVDYGSVPSAAPLPMKANRAAFIRFAAVATLALGALAAVIMVGQARPGMLRFWHLEDQLCFSAARLCDQISGSTSGRVWV